RIDLPLEDEAVLWCARAERDSVQLSRLRDLLTGGEFAWDRCWAVAVVHQVEPLVARALMAEPLAAWLPATVIDNARTSRLATLVANAAIQAELGRIAAALHDHRIPAAP